MNKKLLRTSVIASVMAMAFTASAYASPQDNWLRGEEGRMARITVSYEDFSKLSDAEKQTLINTLGTFANSPNDERYVDTNGLSFLDRDTLITPYLYHPTQGEANHTNAFAQSYICGEQIYDTDLTIGELNQALFALAVNDQILQEQITAASVTDTDKTIQTGNVALADNGTITLQHVDKAGNNIGTTVLTGIASKSALDTEITARANADTSLQNQINANKTNITNNANAIQINKNNITSNLTKITQNTTDIAYNSNRISAIEDSYVKEVSIDQNNGKITFTSVVDGQAQTPVTYTDKHITGYTQTFDEATGKINSSITTNFGGAMNQTVDISGYVGNRISNEAANATYNSETTYGDSTIGGAIQQNTTNITNNTNEIKNIKDNSVTKVVYNNNDTWTIEQKIGGEQSDVTIKDTYVTGINHALDANGNLVTTVQRNQGKEDLVASVKIGDAAINYNGQTIINNDDGSQFITNNTIEQAINNNYNKIVNIEDNTVTNISERQTENVTDNYGKTYNVNYYNVTQTENGEDASTTIKDTTLVQKNLFGEGVRAIDVIVPRVMTTNADGNYDAEQVAAYQDMVNNNALIGYIDQATGVPEIVMEFQDTSGNVVQGAVDFGTLFAESLNTEAGANIVVTQKARGLGNYEIALADDISLRSVTNDNTTVNNELKVAETVTINNTGIQINNKKITGVADGEISSTSQDAVNGRQLWQTNQNLDKLGTRVEKVGAGAAALAALHPMDFDPDDKLQFSAGVGNYRGETAAALGAFYRPTEKVMFSVAGTMGNGENMVNAGVTFALDRKNNVSNSRVAMAHEIQDLRDQVAALTALVSQIAGKGNPMLDTVMFPDVPENHWAYDYVESLQKRGIIEGYPDGNFGGDRSCTRYEYAAMLYRALEKGFPVDGRLLKEFEAELGRIRIDRIKGADGDANKVERVRVNDYEDRDDYGTKLAQVVANAAPSSEEPAA